MTGPPPKLSATEAISSIRDCTKRGVRLLGIDGFTVIPEGFRADLNLLLDVSNRPMAADQAAAKAEAFISEHGRSDVVWEVWVDD